MFLSVFLCLSILHKTKREYKTLERSSVAMWQVRQLLVMPISHISAPVQVPAVMLYFQLPASLLEMIMEGVLNAWASETPGSWLHPGPGLAVVATAGRGSQCRIKVFCLSLFLSPLTPILFMLLLFHSSEN